MKVYRLFCEIHISQNDKKFIKPQQKRYPVNVIITFIWTFFPKFHLFDHIQQNSREKVSNTVPYSCNSMQKPYDNFFQSSKPESLDWTDLPSNKVSTLGRFEDWSTSYQECASDWSVSIVNIAIDQWESLKNQFIQIV